VVAVSLTFLFEGVLYYSIKLHEDCTAPPDTDTLSG
jgi:hypothetical protein